MIFGQNIKQMVSNAISQAGGLPKLTLKRRIYGDHDPTALADGRAITLVTHEGQGVVEWKQRRVGGGTFESILTATIILGVFTPSLPAKTLPKINDIIISNEKTYTIKEIMNIDAAEASCVVRIS